MLPPLLLVLLAAVTTPVAALDFPTCVAGCVVKGGCKVDDLWCVCRAAAASDFLEAGLNCMFASCVGQFDAADRQFVNVINDGCRANKLPIYSDKIHAARDTAQRLAAAQKEKESSSAAAAAPKTTSTTSRTTSTSASAAAQTSKAETSTTTTRAAATPASSREPSSGAQSPAPSSGTGSDRGSGNDGNDNGNNDNNNNNTDDDNNNTNTNNNNTDDNSGSTTPPLPAAATATPDATPAQQPNRPRPDWREATDSSPFAMPIPGGSGTLLPHMLCWTLASVAAGVAIMLR